MAPFLRDSCLKFEILREKLKTRHKSQQLFVFDKIFQKWPKELNQAFNNEKTLISVTENKMFVSASCLKKSSWYLYSWCIMNNMV